MINRIPSSGDMASYTYLPYGYQLQYPKQMKTDDSMAAIRTRFYDDHTLIDVYYDDFNHTVTDAAAYIGYGNRFAKNGSDHRVTEDKNMKVAGSKVHVLKWERDKLERVENDKPYYASAEIVKNDREVYTIQIKSDRPIRNEMDIVHSFRMFPPQGSANVGKVTTRKPLRANKETADLYNRLFLSDGLKWGIYEPDAAKSQMNRLLDLEQKLDYTFGLLIRYQSLDTGFPAEDLTKIYDGGRFAVLTLQTMHYNKDNSSIMYDILKGKYDEYLTKYAQDIKAFGHPLLFRLDNEMNGDWVPYSSYHNSKDTEIYTEMWTYIHDIFSKNEVDNVLWVWNPNNLSKPGFAWNHTLLYYPGDDYVDVVGLTAYNTGTFYEGEEWSTFHELYAPLYAQYDEWFDQPMMIAEFGSSSIGGDKVEWVNGMFGELDQYPKIKAAVWWSHMDFDPNNRPARIYKLDESPELVETFQKHLQSYKPYASAMKR